jgi:hypothetical protein
MSNGAPHVGVAHQDGSFQCHDPGLLNAQQNRLPGFIPTGNGSTFNGMSTTFNSGKHFIQAWSTANSLLWPMQTPNAQCVTLPESAPGVFYHGGNANGNFGQQLLNTLVHFGGYAQQSYVPLPARTRQCTDLLLPLCCQGRGELGGS